MGGRDEKRNEEEAHATYPLHAHSATSIDDENFGFGVLHFCGMAQPDGWLHGTGSRDCGVCVGHPCCCVCGGGEAKKGWWQSKNL